MGETKEFMCWLEPFRHPQKVEATDSTEAFKSYMRKSEFTPEELGDSYVAVQVESAFDWERELKEVLDSYDDFNGRLRLFETEIEGAGTTSGRNYYIVGVHINNIPDYAEDYVMDRYLNIEASCPEMAKKIYCLWWHKQGWLRLDEFHLVEIIDEVGEKTDPVFYGRQKFSVKKEG